MVVIESDVSELDVSELVDSASVVSELDVREVVDNESVVSELDVSDVVDNESVVSELDVSDVVDSDVVEIESEETVGVVIVPVEEIEVVDESVGDVLVITSPPEGSVLNSVCVFPVPMTSE